MIKCTLCNKELSYQSFRIEDNEVCFECWCDAVGDIVEKYPIGGR